MPICVPVRDMKNTADFVGMVERESDVTVTKNGYSVIHCLSESAAAGRTRESAVAFSHDACGRGNREWEFV